MSADGGQSLFSGLTGYVSLGHGVFCGIGAYIVVTSFNVLPIWFSVPLGGLAAGLFALLVAVPVLRVRGPYFVILTFGLAELVKYSVLSLETAMGKSSRLLFGAPDATSLLFGMLALAIVASLLNHYVQQLPLGRGLVAIREDETAAETISVPVTRFKVIAYVISAIIPGMAGGLMALRTTYFEVLQVFNPVVSFTIVTMAVIGGSGDARGPLLGSLLLVGLSQLLWVNAPQLYMILLGASLIVFVLFVPSGLVGLLRSRGGSR